MKELAYANRPNGVAPTQVKTRVVDAYLNLKHLMPVLKRELFSTTFYDIPWKENISMPCYNDLRKELF
jgi:hypothetical protein